MLLVLTNLDTGLFLAQYGWTHDPGRAQTFTDRDLAAKSAIANNVRNAALALLDGNPPRAVGFCWLSKPG